MARPIPVGSSVRTFSVGGHKLRVHTYKPANYRGGPLVAVFHGMNRNAWDYRDFAMPVANRFGMVVAAPEFDLKNFSMPLYQRAGIVYRNALQPRERWTTTLALKLVDAIRRGEGKPDLPHYRYERGRKFLPPARLSQRRSAGPSTGGW